MNGKLVLMVGCPGSGKSTWLKENKQSGEVIVSRDEIRFKILKEADDYFGKEDEVWSRYVATINRHLSYGTTVYADATHLNRGSRLKLLKALKVTPSTIEAVYFKVPLEIAQERNAQRAGRAFVPPEAVEKMYRAIEEPKWYEGMYVYNKIYIIDENGKVEVKE